MSKTKSRQLSIQTITKGNLNRTFINQLNNPTHSNDRVYGDSGVSPSLNTMQGGRRQPKIAIPVLTPDRIEKRQNGRRFKEDGEESFTLTGQDKHGVSDGSTNKTINTTRVREVARLPGRLDRGYKRYTTL